MILKMGALLAIHSCSHGAPMLLKEAKAVGMKPAEKPTTPTPASDKLRAAGLWNHIYASGVFTAKEVELLSIAFDASYTHMYAPDTRRHIKGALASGATMEEIMEVLELCVVQGVQACDLGVPILAEELDRSRAGGNSRS